MSDPPLSDFLTVLTPTRDPAGGDKKEVDTIQSKRNGSSMLTSQELDTSTAILKKKKKPNSLM